MKIKIRKLHKNDNRNGFASGDIEIDRFFIKFAGQNQFRHKIGTTYIACMPHSKKPLGYATVSTGSINIENIKKKEFAKLPDYPIPILRLARLGVDLNYQKRGLAKMLLRHILFLALDIKDKAGCAGVVVDAKEEALTFYDAFGFEILPVTSGELGIKPTPQTMFLSIKTIQKALG